MKTYTMYQIKYIKALCGEIKKYDTVTIGSGDTMRNGEKIHNIFDAIKYFEELAESWGTYENYNAVVDIHVYEI